MKVKKCERCGKEIVVRSSKTKYCPECAAIAKRESQKKWYQNNRESEMARSRRYYRAQRGLDAEEQARLEAAQAQKEELAKEKQAAEKLEAEVKEKKGRKKLHVVPALSIDEVLRRAKGTGLSYGQYVSQMEREATA